MNMRAQVVSTAIFARPLSVRDAYPSLSALAVINGAQVDNRSSFSSSRELGSIGKAFAEPGVQGTSDTIDSNTQAALSSGDRKIHEPVVLRRFPIREWYRKPRNAHSGESCRVGGKHSKAMSAVVADIFERRCGEDAGCSRGHPFEANTGIYDDESTVTTASAKLAKEHTIPRILASTGSN